MLGIAATEYNCIIKIKTNAKDLLKLAIPGLAILGCIAGIASVVPTTQLTSVLLAAQSAKETDKPWKGRTMSWSPPLVDAPLGAGVSPASCDLPDILRLAGARANDLYTNLQSFAAQERIEYGSFDHTGYPLDARHGTFDYVVLFEQGAKGTNVQESRQPMDKSVLLPMFSSEIGLPGMALLFLPELQDEYKMSCEGTTDWHGKTTKVIHFVHRRDKPNHTLSYRDRGGVAHAANLKGRAWIAADSGEVLHMEFSLLQGMTEVKLVEWYLSINYAPVEFQKQSVRMVLPQTVDAYYNFNDHRTIVYHAFSDFKLFSIQTDQKPLSPKTQ